MSITITRGNAVIVPQMEATDFSYRDAESPLVVEIKDGKIVIKNASSGASFVILDTKTRHCSVDILNVPHIDVAAAAKRLADAEKKKAAAAEEAKQKKAAKLLVPAHQ